MKFSPDLTRRDMIRRVGLGLLGGASLVNPKSDDVNKVTLKNAAASYSGIAEAEIYSWPLSTFVPGVLKTFDLPDCYRALQAKNLRLIEPAGAAI